MFRRRVTLGLSRTGARAGALSHPFPPRWRRISRGRRQEAAGRRSASGWRRSAPRSARTCWPTRRTTRWCSKRAILPACRISCWRLRALLPMSAARPASTSITLSRSSIEPFLQFSSRRDLREKAFHAWIARGENGGATDNSAIIAEMVALRAERAKLLGYAELRRITGSTTRWPRRRRRRASCWTRSGGAAAPARDGRARRAAGDDARGGRQFRARAAGTGAITPRSSARRATISTRRRSSRISSSTA